MRNLLCLALVTIMAIILSGCASTLSEDSKTHTKRVQRNMQKDCKLMVEDWDSFWMCDEPSRATKNNM
jgi:uncharacterized protein YceK